MSENVFDLAAAATPLFPAFYDVAWTVLAVAMLVLTVWALVSLSRAQRANPAFPGSFALVWVLLVLLIPVLGAVAWFTVGRTAAARERL